MKRKWKAFVGILLSTIFIGSSIGGCAQKEPDKTVQKEATDPDTEPENEFQSNLDVIRPQAYSTIDGLRLEKGTYISVIGRADSSEYWKSVKAGAEQAAKDLNTMLGYKNEDKIKVNYSGPSQEESVDEQINILDEELARYPSAVGIAAIDATACTVQFDLAAENDIPIVTFDSGSAYKDIASRCSTDNTAAAQTAAAKLSDAVDNKGDIAIFVHDAKSTTGMEREKAFVEDIKKNHQEIRVVKIYHMDELEAVAKQIAQEKSTEGHEVAADTITQADAAKYILEKNPGIAGCYATNVTATQMVVEACADLEKKDMKIVGFDGGEKQIGALEDESVTGLVVQNPYGMGYATVVAAARAVLGLGNEATIDTGYTWVTKSNMDKKAIQKMLY